MNSKLLVTLLVSSGMFALATSASAEGAWVLWGQIQDPWGALEAVPLGGGLSREACEQERSNREKEPAVLRMASTLTSPTPWTRVGRRGSECPSYSLARRLGSAEVMTVQGPATGAPGGGAWLGAGNG
jgi:hypothetical protein